MKGHSRVVPSRVTLGLLLLLAGCGGGGSSPTMPSGPTTTTVIQGTFTVLDPLTAVAHPNRVCEILFVAPFTTSGAGRLDVTVDWTHASNDLDVAVARGACDCALAMAEACDSVAETNSTTAKPERIRVENLAAGSYTLAVGNFGPGQEAGSYVVQLTR